jgi:hypothetical protein
MLTSKRFWTVIGTSLLVLANGKIALAQAKDQDVTLTGLISCARCTLKVTTQCANAIEVTNDGKTTTYFFVDQGAKEKYHAEVCGNGKQAGKVTGKVSEKEGKKWITPKKVEYTAAKTGDSRPTTEWNRNYSEALAAAKTAGKPLAVFLASGETGWNKVAREGELTDTVQSLLNERYVCLYLDADCPHGKAMASAFDVKGGVGVVISDKVGTTQAFHHCGTLPASDLAACLTRCGGTAAKANCPLCVAANAEHGAVAPTAAVHVHGDTASAATCPNCAAGAATTVTATTASVVRQPVAVAAGASCCGKR